MHRGRLYQQIPARSPPCPPLVPRREHRYRQSDQSLLVSPSRVSPPGRSPDPPDRDQSDPTETTPIGAPFPRPDITPSSPSHQFHFPTGCIAHLAETFNHSRKRMTAWSCQRQGAGSTFPPTPKGKPGGGSDREVRRGESRSEAAVREPGATGKPREPGTGGRPDGDPSGSSSGHRTASLTTRKVFPETGRSRSSDRTPADGFGHRQELHSELGPRPDIEWARVPRGLRLRPRLPRDFLVWRDVTRTT